MYMEFAEYCERLMEEHIPVAFVDYDTLRYLKSRFQSRMDIGRKEALVFLYIIGATADESNALLHLLGYPLLDVKRREDAIWKFALKKRLDSKTIIDMIFLQNVDESGPVE